MLRYFCLCSSYSIASYSQLLHSTAFINLLSLLSMATDLSNLSLNLLSTDTHLSFEYIIFKNRTIFPSIINSCIWEQLGTPHVSLSFATVHPLRAILYFLRIPSTPKRIRQHPSLLFLTLATSSASFLLIFKGISVPNMQIILFGSSRFLQRVQK